MISIYHKVNIHSALLSISLAKIAVEPGADSVSKLKVRNGKSWCLILRLILLLFNCYLSGVNYNFLFSRKGARCALDKRENLQLFIFCVSLKIESVQEGSRKGTKNISQVAHLCFFSTWVWWLVKKKQRNGEKFQIRRQKRCSSFRARERNRS